MDTTTTCLGASNGIIPSLMGCNRASSSSVDCCSSNTVSAEVTHPLHARQSCRVTLTGLSGASVGCVWRNDAGALGCSCTMPTWREFFVDGCVGVLNDVYFHARTSSAGACLDWLPSRLSTHAWDGAMKSFKSASLTVPLNPMVLLLLLHAILRLCFVYIGRKNLTCFHITFTSKHAHIVA